MDSYPTISQKCFQSEKLFDLSHESNNHFETQIQMSHRSNSNGNLLTNGGASSQLYYQSVQYLAQTQGFVKTDIIQSKKSSIKSILIGLSLGILIFLIFTFGIYFRSPFSQAPSHDQRLTQQAKATPEPTQNPSTQVQKSTEPEHQTNAPATNNQSIESNQIPEKAQPQEQQQQDFLDYLSLSSPTIQWPQQNELYHIYSALNPRLVLDVAVAKDGYHDLILYDWKNQLNQMYYFQKVKQNYYHIVNAESKEYMKKSQKFVAISNVSKIKFSKQPSKLWKLIPAKLNVNNSFYIVSQDSHPRQALDLNEGYAQQFAEIIQYKFHRFSNQVWILRKNIDSMSVKEKSTQKFKQKASELLYNVMHIPDSINQAITLQEMKLQMNNKKIPLPSWLKKPAQNRVDDFDLPLQTTQKDFQSYLQAKKASLESKQLPKQLSKQSIKKSSQDLDDEDDDDDDGCGQDQDGQKKPCFVPPYLAVECAKNHKVAYIWYGGTQMPKQYKFLLEKCSENAVLLTQFEFQAFLTAWNLRSSTQYQILPEQMPIRQRVNMLKLLYLYFESGIYADFDTQINEQCFQKIYANEIIFTNRVQENIKQPLFFPVEEIVVPEESFMMIRTKRHPQVKRMIEEEIMEHDNGGGDRWRECKYRQCLIVQCQRHYRDNTYKKGFV